MRVFAEYGVESDFEELQPNRLRPGIQIVSRIGELRAKCLHQILRHGSEQLQVVSVFILEHYQEYKCIFVYRPSIIYDYYQREEYRIAFYAVSAVGSLIVFISAAVCCYCARKNKL